MISQHSVRLDVCIVMSPHSCIMFPEQCYICARLHHDLLAKGALQTAWQQVINPWHTRHNDNKVSE